MAALPYMQLYVADYLADTMHLTAEQDGIYRRLIDHYMETQKPLPNNSAALARISGVDTNVFCEAFKILDDFLEHKNELLFLKKCDAVLKYQTTRHRQRKK